MPLTEQEKRALRTAGKFALRAAQKAGKTTKRAIIKTACAVCRLGGGAVCPKHGATTTLRGRF